jgi:multidrug resistance protein, MATE family
MSLAQAYGANPSLPSQVRRRIPIDEGRSLIRLALPIMAIALVNMGMSLTETAMVAGLFGTDAFASVAVGSDLCSIAFYLGAGTLAGVAPFYTAAAARADADARPGSSGSVGWRWHSSRRSRCRCSGLPPRWLALRKRGDPWTAARGSGNSSSLPRPL